MLVQSFISVVESSVANHGWRGASGYVTDVESLTTEAAMSALDEAHRGCFAFLAFDGKIDPVVKEYVANGSLAVDSGPNVLVLFTMQEPVSTPRRLSPEVLKGTTIIDDGKHPAYDYVRRLVPEITNPSLPCVVIFKRFANSSEPVIVGLGDAASAAEVRQRLQTIFQLASSYAATSENGDFATRLSVALTDKGIDYIRGGKTSVREWLTAVFVWARRNVSTVVSVLKLFA